MYVCYTNLSCSTGRSKFDCYMCTYAQQEWKAVIIVRVILYLHVADLLWL